jgi:hypothetical protein
MIEQDKGGWWGRTYGVHAKEGDAKQAERESLWNGEVEVVPLRSIVTSPMTSNGARAWKG